ncbi:MAG: TatD family hydrolase, partial [Acidobacteriaceae bacterium]|nr:TatD family hydrolase [Acidobacteriaceae bacterium]
MIDSHCHLADDIYIPDLDAVIARAKAAGLERVLVILEAGHEGEVSQAERVVTLWPESRVAIGVHPHHAGRYAGDPSRATATVARQLDTTPAARAIGEIGLDYHYDLSPRDLQQVVFREQIRLALARDLPIVVHTREAEEDTLTIFREEGEGRLRGVLHCFTSSPALADAALALGFSISFSGIVTFPKSGELRETARRVPLDRLLVETDSPFLAPPPYRGQRNEPA